MKFFKAEVESPDHHEYLCENDFVLLINQIKQHLCDVDTYDDFMMTEKISIYEFDINVTPESIKNILSDKVYWEKSGAIFSGDLDELMDYLITNDHSINDMQYTLPWLISRKTLTEVKNHIAQTPDMEHDYSSAISEASFLDRVDIIKYLIKIYSQDKPLTKEHKSNLSKILNKTHHPILKKIILETENANNNKHNYHNDTFSL